MNRISERSLVRGGAAALLLVAVLATPNAASAAAGNCSGTSADAWIDYVWWQANVLEGEGAWLVNGASSARVEYFVDGVLYQSSYPSGSSGSWNWWSFVDDFTQCGTHTFEVKVCPRVSDGSGYTVCETHCDSTSSTFSTFNCPDNLDVSYSCTLSGGGGAVTVQGTILAGDAPYEVEVADGSIWSTLYASTYSTGPFSHSARCTTPSDRIGMRITDADGDQKTRYCYCFAE